MIYQTIYNSVPEAQEIPFFYVPPNLAWTLPLKSGMMQVGIFRQLRGDTSVNRIIVGSAMQA